MLKIHSPQITHKTDVGGVMLNISSDEKVRSAFDEITSRAKQKRPDADIIGVTVQKMVTYPNSFELIMGTKKDPIFGSVIMIGMGGVAAEVFQDRALGLPPLNTTLARRLMAQYFPDAPEVAMPPEAMAWVARDPERRSAERLADREAAHRLRSG